MAIVIKWAYTQAHCASHRAVQMRSHKQQSEPSELAMRWRLWHPARQRGSGALRRCPNWHRLLSGLHSTSAASERSWSLWGRVYASPCSPDACSKVLRGFVWLYLWLVPLLCRACGALQRATSAIQNSPQKPSHQQKILLLVCKYASNKIKYASCGSNGTIFVTIR
jgi:hypothetical protein